MFGLALSSSVRREADRADHLEKELAEAREQATEAEQLAAQTRRSFEDFLLLAKAAVAGSVTVAVVAGVVAFMSIRSKKQVSTRLAAAVSRSAELEKTAQLLQTQNKDLKKFGHQKFATAMLGTADDLRRALDHISEDSLKNPEVEALHSGIEMVSTGFQRRLNEFDIMRVNPLGELFDPHFHEAVQRVDDPEVPFNHVTEVMQDGYTLSGRCIRPALVVVNMSAELGAPSAQNEEGRPNKGSNGEC